MVKIKATEKNTLIKHSAVVHISNSLTVIERKISNILLKNAFSNLSKVTKHSISIREILNELGHSEDGFKNYAFIVDSIQKLVSTSVTFNILAKDKKRKWAGTMALLAEAFPKGGCIEYSYPPSLIECMARPNIYTTLNLNYQKDIKSKYSLALWEFCNEQLDTARSPHVTTEVISLEKIKDLLGANEKIYNEFKVLNYKILKPAVLEVNANTDININIYFKRAARKVFGIVFEVSRLNLEPIQRDLFDENIDAITLLQQRALEDEALNIGNKLGFEDDNIYKLVDMYGIEKVRSILNFTYLRIKEGEGIENIGGYVYTLLEKGIFNNVGSSDIRNLEKVCEDKAKEQLELEINDFIEREQDTYRKAILNGCRSAMHPKIMKLALEEENIVVEKIEQGEDKSIVVFLKRTMRLSGYEEEIKQGIIYSFKKLKIKAEVEIIR